MRQRRLRIRTRQRGTREICVIFERYLKAINLGQETDISDFESLLHETDQDIEYWLGDRTRWPDRHAGILADITATLNLDPEPVQPRGKGSAADWNGQSS